MHPHSPPWLPPYDVHLHYLVIGHADWVIFALRVSSEALGSVQGVQTRFKCAPHPPFLSSQHSRPCSGLITPVSDPVIMVRK